MLMKKIRASILNPGDRPRHTSSLQLLRHAFEQVHVQLPPVITSTKFLLRVLMTLFEKYLDADEARGSRGEGR